MSAIVSLMALMSYSLIVMYAKGIVTIGDFAFVLTVSMSIFQSIWDLANRFVEFAEEFGKCAQALTLITMPHDIIDAPNAKSIMVTRDLLNLIMSLSITPEIIIFLKIKRLFLQREVKLAWWDFRGVERRRL